MLRTQITTCAVGLLLLLGSGCEEFGGGATYEARVSVLSADHFSDDASETAVGGAGAESSASSSDASSGGFGTFAGRVVMSGSAPTLALLVAKGADVKDKEVCAAVDVPDERLVIGADGGVANAFVYLKRAPRGGKPLEASAEPMFFDQKNCRFLPHCMIVPTGSVVRVLSDDPIAHNTHTYPQKSTGVNSGVAPGDREGKLEVQYRSAEAPVSVKCDYHAWMQAYHLPVDHPYAAVTDADGNFTIADLPAGEHEFVIWHESAPGGFISKKFPVNVSGGQTTTMDVEFAADKLALK